MNVKRMTFATQIDFLVSGFYSENIKLIWFIIFILFIIYLLRLVSLCVYLAGLIV